MTATTFTGSAGSAACRDYAEYLLQSAVAAKMADRAEYYAGEANGFQLRPDLSPEFAAALGIDQSRPLKLEELTSLMDRRRADGREIEGRKKHSAHQSIASVFGLDKHRMPTANEIRNVLAGKRADGEAPRENRGNGQPLTATRVASAVKGYRRAIGVPRNREVTGAEIQRVVDGKINVADYNKRIVATTPAVGYTDITLSPDKTISVAYSQSERTERDAIDGVVREAAWKVMHALERHEIGYVRRGGAETREAAEMVYGMAVHNTARPVYDAIKRDSDGHEYTAPMTVPMAEADPQLHPHMIVFSAARGKDGHIGSLPFGEVHPLLTGAMFQAELATGLRALGARVHMGPYGEARLTDIPESFRAYASRRSQQGKQEVIAKWAKENGGVDWAALTDDEKAAKVEGATKERATAIREKRQDKPEGKRRDGDEAEADFATWQRDAKAFGYDYKPVLGQVVHRAVSDDVRIEQARNASLPLIEKEFKTKSVIAEPRMKEFAARGLIVAGVGKDIGADIASVVQTYQDRGVRVDGQLTRLDRIQALDKDGRSRVSYTTAATVEQEQRLIDQVKALAADKTGALTTTEIDAAAERFLAANPHVDRDGKQWLAQAQAAQEIGQGARVHLMIGVHGAGKTKAVVGVLTDAWHWEGREVIGVTAPWKASGELKSAKVDQTMAIDALVHRYKAGKVKIDYNTRIVADESSLVSTRHADALLDIVEQTGARIAVIGDPKQIASVETPALDLMVRAIGDEQISKILTTVRQRDDHDKVVALKWREGDAAGAIEALQADGRFQLVAGGSEKAIHATVKLWRELTDAGSESLLVMAPSNRAGRQVGEAIRANRQQAGEIGPDLAVVKAVDKNSGERFDLPLAVGDKLRMFTRTFDADTPGRGKHLSDNGDIVEIRAVLTDGIRVRNEAGVEGRVTWSQMRPFRAPKNDPIQAANGYVLTPDTAQSLTRSNTIFAAVEGLSSTIANKAYTAMSRAVDKAYLVVSESHESAALVRARMIGAEKPTRQDVIDHIAERLSRFAEPLRAMDVLQRAQTVQRGKDPAAKTRRQRPTVTQAQRDAGRRRSEAQPQNEAEQANVREQLQQQQRSRGLER